MEEFKNLKEIIELSEEEINNNDENVSAVLDLVDLKELRNLVVRNKELEEALIDMVNQFAYDEKRKKFENERLYTAGLSALENAFDVLDIDEGIRRKDLWKKI